MDIFIPGYRIERLIGRGGMAEVYLAVQESLSRQVALKVLPRGFSSDREFAERFKREAQTCAALQHPNIIKIFDSGVYEGWYYIAMDYLDGGTLKDLIQQGLPLIRSLDILYKLTDALGYAHRHGVIHRDLKPSNVLIYGGKEPVLSDFGIARLVDSNSTLTASGAAIGSPSYMSPEQAKGLKVDARADIYSLGVIFYEMLTGHPPYQASDSFALLYKQVHDPVPRLPAHLSQYQPIIDGMMAKDRNQRFSSAEEVLKALNAIPLPTGQSISLGEDQKTVILDTQSSLSRLRQSQSNKPAKKKSSLIIALLFIVGSGGAFYWWQSQQLSLDEIIIRTEQNLQAQQLDQAEKLLRRGLAKEPFNPQLLALVEQLRQAKEKQALSLQINQLERSIQLALNNQKYQRAWRNIKELERLPNTEKKVQQWLQRLQAQWQQNIQDLIREERLAEAEHLLDRAQQTLGTSSKWADLQQKLMVQKQAIQARKIERLKIQIEEQIAAEKWQQAQYGIQQLQSLDPKLSERLEQKLNKQQAISIQKLSQWIEEQIAAQNYAQAQYGLQQLKALDPQHDLSHWQQRIDQGLQALKRKKQFNELIQQAQLALKQADYSLALEKAQQARALNYDKKAAQNLIDQIIAEQKAAAYQLKIKEYNQLIDRVQQALEQKQFEQARLLAQQALELDYQKKATQKLIEQIDKAQRFAQKQYWQSLMQASEQALQNNQFDLAAQKAEQALALKINEQQAQQLKQRIAQKQIEALQQDLQQALQQNDFALAQQIWQSLKQKGADSSLLAHFEQKIADKQNINQLLEQADQLKAEGHLQAALAQLQKVLAIEAENKTAKQKLKIWQAERDQKIKELKQAWQQAMQAQQWQQAEQHLQALKALGVETQTEEQQWQQAYARYEQVQNHLEKAKQALAAGKYEQSLQVLQRVLDIEPQHQEAQRLIQSIQKNLEQKKAAQLQAEKEQKIVQLKRRLQKAQQAQDWQSFKAHMQRLAALGQNIDHYALKFKQVLEDKIKQAREAQQQGKHQQVQRLLAELKILAGDQQDIQAAIAELEQQEQQRQNKQQQIKQLLQQAQRQIKRYYLTTPKGNNAYESYLKILEIEPEHPEAQQGIKKIAAIYWQLAQRNQKRGRYQKALAQIDKAIKLDPRPSYIQLRASLKQKIMERHHRNKPAEPQKTKPVAPVEKPVEKNNKAVAKPKPVAKTPPSTPEQIKEAEQPKKTDEKSEDKPEKPKIRVFGNF